MGVVSNASVLSASQRKYVGMFHEVLMRHSVSYGKSANFAQLVPKLMRNDQLRVEFSMLVQWIQRQEEGHLTLNEMLTIVGIAMTGSNADGLRSPSSGPLMILLSGLGGWPETEANRESTATSAPTSSASQSGAQFGTFTSVDRKDERREAQDSVDRWAAAARRRRLMAALWLLPIVPLLILCVALYRNYVGRRGAMPSEAVTNSAPAAEETGRSSRGGRSSRASPRGQTGVEDSGKRAASGPGEQAIEAWPASIVVYGERGPIRFDQAGRIQSAPAKIHASKPEPPPTISEGGARIPAVVPEAVVTMSYPKVVAREASSTAPNGGRPGVAGTESRTLVVVASATVPPDASVARGDGGSTSVKALSSAKPFDLLHPRVSVSAGLLSNDIVRFQMPAYPKSARRQRLQGDVLVRVLISEKGKIVRAVALNGPQSLRDAAEKAVSHWRYVPYIEDGKPVVVQTWVTFHFELREG